MTFIQGRLENIIYHNQDNGYCVFSLQPEEDESDSIVCTGYIAKANLGEVLKVSGEYTHHHTYGKQLKVTECHIVMPTSVQGIEKYLASSIKGVGKKMAKKIVTTFGDKTLDIIENNPERLAKIRGISLQKALEIGEIILEQTESRRVILYLQELGLPLTYAGKVYNKYKHETISIVKKNPYILAENIVGIGFKIADSIAFKAGISKDDPFRIQVGVKHVLSIASTQGHVYLPKNILLDDASDLLQVPIEVIDNCIMEMQIQKLIWVEKINTDIRVFLNSYYYAENIVAKKMIAMSEYDSDEKINIEKYERENNIQFAEQQKLAVLEAMRSSVMVITGGPGTGKTTIIKAIISLMTANGDVVELAAPTGKAAKRMTAATGVEAKTIHRLLGIKFISEENIRQIFEKNEEDPIDSDVVIIDESSMIDIMLMSHLLKAIQPPTRLILLGDVDQLPSVGAGNVLKDIICSNCIKTVKLTEIFRQAQKSAIVTNAHKVNKGNYPDLSNNNDFFFMKRTNQNYVINTMVELITKRLPAYKNYDNVKDIQILTPMRKSALGSTELNKVLQSVLNPPSKDKKEKEFGETIFREGDKVMQIKNNYNITWKEYDKNGRQTGEGVGVFNGDEGNIIRINEVNRKIVVVYDETKYVEYDYNKLEEIDLSYAVTIHKSQGCEYKVIIIPVHSGPPMLMSRNLLYTAITRAKELVVLVGIEETIYRMVDNDKGVDRYSSLDEKLNKMLNFAK